MFVYFFPSYMHRLPLTRMPLIWQPSLIKEQWCFWIPRGPSSSSKRALCYYCKLPWLGGVLGLCGTSNVAQPPVVEVISWCNEEREKEERWTAEGCTVSIIILQGFGRTMHCWGPGNLYTWLPMKRVIKKCHCLLGKTPSHLKRMMIISVTALFSRSLLFVLVETKNAWQCTLS